MSRTAADVATRWALPLLLAALGVVYVATIRDGMALGSDASLYLIHARNLVEGLPYNETQFFVNPTKPDHSPVAYPPLYSLMLAPVYGAVGLQLHAMQLQMALFLVAALAAVYLAFRRDLGAWRALAVTGLLGLAPYLFFLKDDLVSDIPFLALCYATLALLRRTEGDELSPRRRLIRGAAIGVLVYLCYATRTLGAILLPCLLLAELIRYRRFTSLGVTALVVLAGLAVIQRLLIPPVSSYFDVPFEPRYLISNGFGYPRVLAAFWFDGFPAWSRVPAFAVLALLAVAGWLARSTKRIGVFEVFIAAYTVVIVLWPGRLGARYALPIIPLLLYYAYHGLETASTRLRLSSPALAPAMLTAVLLTSSLLTPRQSGPQPRGIDRPATTGLVSFLQQRTPPDAVLVGETPRLWALLARRPATIYDSELGDDEQLAFLARIEARYIVVDRTRRTDRSYLYPLLERQAACFARAYGNEEFELYRVLIGDAAAPACRVVAA